MAQAPTETATLSPTAIPSLPTETAAPLPIATAEPNLDGTSAHTPQSIGVVTTIHPTVTPLPPTTPTTGGEALSGQSVGGYVFGTPELIFKTNDITKLLGWSPHDDLQLLLKVSRYPEFIFTLETLNVDTGKRDLILETPAETDDVVWLPERHQLAYLIYNEAGTYRDLWLADTSTGASQKVAVNVPKPLLFNPITITGSADTRQSPTILDMRINVVDHLDYYLPLVLK